MRLFQSVILLGWVSLISACGGGGSSGGGNTSSALSSAAPSSASSSSLSSVALSSSSQSSSSAASASSTAAGALAVSPFIVVDQFGYLPDAHKVAVIRDPHTGYDAAQSFTPGTSLALVDMDSGETLLTAATTAWNSGATDSSSGDKAWWFDFSSITTPGTYAVVDTSNQVRSPSFKIAADVYRPVLYHAFRTLFYQRAGFAKQQPYAEAAWVDGASHIQANQDTGARLYSDKNNAATAKDLSGGWYDAGDYNKYTSWSADYVVTLLHAYPNVLFYNNDNSQTPGSAGLGAGQQETDNAGRAMKKRMAAIYLYAATGDTSYRDFIDANYTQAPLKAWNNFADPFRENENTSLLYYTSLPGASSAVVNDLKASYASAMGSVDNWQAIRNNADPYRAYLHSNHYTWGSNSVKSLKGSMFTNLVSFAIAGTDTAEARNAALRYLNYLHGVNPQGKVYLSNMYSEGVHNSVNEFYHSWFSDGSNLWDSVGGSVYGPAPGFLVGGPNPSYDWDGNCTSNNPNPNCGSAAPNPPKGQPPQKAYKDFNTSWPINSWSVTENSNGYQTNYLRLLSKFVSNPD